MGIRQRIGYDQNDILDYFDFNVKNKLGVVKQSVNVYR